MQKITPCLWFDHQAEEAARFYTGLFENSRLLEFTRCAENMPLPAGTVLTVTFELDGQRFMALNGGPLFKFNEAISMFVNCKTQEEVDALWASLTEGGEESQCGWLKDRYGVSWQIVPEGLNELLFSPDAERAGRATRCMLTMKKLDLAQIRQAYDGA
jgi:predicted 3-demethylubiquinone-9 3-methyltransferase (glyoxalase superfamily)